MEKVANRKIQKHKFRYERKFHVRNLSYSEIVNIIKMHPAGFRHHHPARSINNIYFDTYGYTAAIENIEGIAKRVKTRIRWYGESFGVVSNPMLEFKIKNGFIGRKESYALSGFTFDEEFTADRCSDYISICKLPDAVSLRLSYLTPTLFNSYNREYLLSADGAFRLTIDNHMSYYKISSNHNNFLFKNVDRQSTILELKYDEEYDSLAERITSRFPFRVSKSSKYVTGIINTLLLSDFLN